MTGPRERSAAAPGSKGFQGFEEFSLSFFPPPPPPRVCSLASSVCVIYSVRTKAWMIPAGYSTTTTAVTRRILFPAAVTGVTADSWNVTGDVARGAASRRKGEFVSADNSRYIEYTGIPDE